MRTCSAPSTHLESQLLKRSVLIHRAPWDGKCDPSLPKSTHTEAAGSTGTPFKSMASWQTVSLQTLLAGYDSIETGVTFCVALECAVGTWLAHHTSISICCLWPANASFWRLYSPYRLHSTMVTYGACHVMTKGRGPGKPTCFMTLRPCRLGYTNANEIRVSLRRATGLTSLICKPAEPAECMTASHPLSSHMHCLPDSLLAAYPPNKGVGTQAS